MTKKSPANSLRLWLPPLVAFLTSGVVGQGTVSEDESKGGAVLLQIMVSDDNVQSSNFGHNSFRLSNVGTKDISEFMLDVRGALFPGMVFDPEGLAGDSIAKPLHIDSDEATGVINPGALQGEIYLGDGGAAGYTGMRLIFDEATEGGFNPGESVGFSVDMDPNSIAGTQKGPLDAGASPGWDVGGVSGAELIGSRFEVRFTDGTTASGRLHSTGTQAGAHGLASQGPLGPEVTLEVNAVQPGSAGSYDAGTFNVVVNGPAGVTARVVMAKGFIQPVSPYATFVHEQLNEVASSSFPANNAVEFQVIDVTLTGQPLDISDRFRINAVENYDFEQSESQPFSIDEDKLPLAFIAATVDPAQNHAPIGPLTLPIYLQHD